MEGGLECGSVDDRALEIGPMFTCRPRPNPSTYCGIEGIINSETDLEYRSRFNPTGSPEEHGIDYQKRYSPNASNASYDCNSSTSMTSDLDVSLTRKSEEDTTHCMSSCKSRTSPNSCIGASANLSQNGTSSSMTPSSNSDVADDREDCHFNIEKEAVGLIGQLNDKLRLGQSLDIKTSEQVGLVSKAISKLNGCRPKYPSSLGEMPNLCLSKHRNDLDTRVPPKESKMSAKCSSDCANPSCKPFAQCHPDNWYSEAATMSNGMNGFVGLNNKDGGCYRLNCQSQLCQSRAQNVDCGPFLSYVSECVANDRKTFQTQSSLDSVTYVGYESETQMPDIMRLIQKDLSEPYSVYTYRYFIHNWPHLCYLALIEDACVGAIVCKLDMHKKNIRRGYIAMLAVDEKYRKKRIGSNLVLKAIQAMIADDADEVVLETEITNKPALQLYENLGFVRDKRLFRYYLNGVDALRLKLWLR